MTNQKRKYMSSIITLDDVTHNMKKVQINTNSAVIYSRVSTNRQQRGTSLESQISLCQDYCNIMKFNTIDCVKEICSATEMSKQNKLNGIIINNSNIHLIILEPSRLSRNIKDLTCLLDKCNKQNIILHFAQSITSSDNSQDIKKILSNVYDAEIESKTLSQRIKRSISFRKQMKIYLPSVPSFGLMIKNKQICLNPSEQDIITLINKLFWGSDINSINKLLYKITGVHDEICCLYDNDEIFEIKHGNMLIIDIVHFLNNLVIKSRGKQWNSNSVSKLIKN